MKVVITAGGTGGHIFPALAVINKIKEKDKNSKFLYIGTTDRMEKDIIPKEGIPYVGIRMIGINRRNPFKNINVIKCYIEAVKKAREELIKFKPDLVIGFGGYISAPVIYAAKKLNIKTMIHEQNSIPGVSNKFLSRYTDKILISFEESKEYFDKEKCIYTGNPRSEQINDVKKVSKETLGFKNNLPLVIIVMGSLGSMTMNQKLKSMLSRFNDKNYQVLLITGKNYYDDYKDIKIPNNVKIIPFYNNLIALMKDTDLMVTRSGASTIAEITSIGLPSIMVPSPYVTNDHQMKNAKALENDGACKIIAEDMFNADSLIPLIDEILSNKGLIRNMKKALSKRKVSDSATKIYMEAVKLVKDE